MKKEIKDKPEPLFDASKKSLGLDFSARGLHGNVINFQSRFSTSAKDVQKILSTWRSMEDTITGMDDQAQQAEDQLLLPVKQLSYIYKNVSPDDISENFDVSTISDMVSHVAGRLMGSEAKGADSTG